jgi:hypothetical protein
MCIVYAAKGAYIVKQERDKQTGAKHKYYHFIKDMDVITDPFRLHHILKTVFADLAMKCIISSMPPRTSPVVSWLSGLRTLPNLHFDSAVENHSGSTSSTNIDIESFHIGDPPLPEPHSDVLHGVPELDQWLAFDVETHDLVPKSSTGNAWVEGKFGHQCRIQEGSMKHLRMVQIGWCAHMPNATGIVENKYFIKPDGFEVTNAAESKHHISNDTLRKSGKLLRDVLDEFLSDVAHIVQHGGAVCAHQLEFDAGIVALEMERVGLHNKLALWEQSVQQGVCTMNPVVSKWSCEIYFDVAIANAYAGLGSSVGICNMILALLPHEHKHICHHHDAGTDAHMVWKLVGELQRRLLQYRQSPL